MSVCFVSPRWDVVRVCCLLCVVWYGVNVFGGVCCVRCCIRCVLCVCPCVCGLLGLSVGVVCLDSAWCPVCV